MKFKKIFFIIFFGLNLINNCIFSIVPNSSNKTVNNNLKYYKLLILNNKKLIGLIIFFMVVSFYIFVHKDKDSKDLLPKINHKISIAEQKIAYENFTLFPFEENNFMIQQLLQKNQNNLLFQKYGCKNFEPMTLEKIFTLSKESIENNMKKLGPLKTIEEIQEKQRLSMEKYDKILQLSLEDFEKYIVELLKSPIELKKFNNFSPVEIQNNLKFLFEYYEKGNEILEFLHKNYINRFLNKISLLDAYDAGTYYKDNIQPWAEQSYKKIQNIIANNKFFIENENFNGNYVFLNKKVFQDKSDGNVQLAYDMYHSPFHMVNSIFSPDQMETLLDDNTIFKEYKYNQWNKELYEKLYLKLMDFYKKKFEFEISNIGETNSLIMKDMLEKVNRILDIIQVPIESIKTNARNKINENLPKAYNEFKQIVYYLIHGTMNLLILDIVSNNIDKK